MASERTSTMRSPCDNHAIISRAEVVAKWPQVNARLLHDKRAIILLHSCHCQAMINTLFKNRFTLRSCWTLPFLTNMISLVAEKWQVMASERTTTMRSPCDNHAITSRAEIVANWPQVNARQSHDKRATIFRHSCHCQAMWYQAIRGRNMRYMHMLKLFAPSIWKSWIRPCFSACDVHLVVYAMQSNHGQFFSSRVHAEANIASCTGCMAATMFSEAATFVMYWNECMLLLLEPSDQPFHSPASFNLAVVKNNLLLTQYA